MYGTISTHNAIDIGSKHLTSFGTLKETLPRALCTMG